MSDQESEDQHVNLGTQTQELPELTLKNVLLDIKTGIGAMLFDPFYKRVVGPALAFFASLITKIIIAKVPYTEIDFKTYMQQVAVANSGEIDYSLITGDTGPAVYPAGFIQVYQAIYWLTKGGTNVLEAQTIFSYLFVFSMIMAMLTYVSVPPWTLVLLVASKRLMSIYVLRLFNDCFTTAAMIGVTLILQQIAYWYSSLNSTMILVGSCVAADLFSLAISVKMNALLYLPAFIIVVYFLNHENLLKTLVVMFVIPVIQVLVGWKFLVPMYNDEVAKYLRWTYLNQAFKFDRKFLYEWTVNWRFVPEEIFLSDSFSNGLLIGHATVLLLFIFTRYLSDKVTGKSAPQLIKDGFKVFSNTISPANLLVRRETGPKLIMLIFASTNMIGILFARSLHYQFLSWYCWQLPFMICMTNWPFYVCVPVWLAHEWCWNTFPSTEFSSALLVTILALVILGVWNSNQWYKHS